MFVFVFKYLCINSELKTLKLCQKLQNRNSYYYNRAFSCVKKEKQSCILRHTSKLTIAYQSELSKSQIETTRRYTSTELSQEGRNLYYNDHHYLNSNEHLILNSQWPLEPHYTRTLQTEFAKVQNSKTQDGCNQNYNVWNNPNSQKQHKSKLTKPPHIHKCKPTAAQLSEIKQLSHFE